MIDFTPKEKEIINSICWLRILNLARNIAIESKNPDAEILLDDLENISTSIESIRCKLKEFLLKNQ